MNPVNGRPSIPAYNTQVSVDTRTQLIVAADVCDDRTDQKQFSEQHQQAERNLGPDANRQYVADAGYHSLDQLAYVEQEQVDAVIADPRPERRDGVARGRGGNTRQIFDRGMFTYDTKADSYRCPAGDTLRYWHTESHRGRKRRIYQGQVCVGCPMRSQCIRSANPKRLRTVVRDTQEQLAEAMLQKARSPDGRHRMDLRKASAEPVFGNLKSNLGFRRFRLRGISKVKGEFMLMCIGHNLAKLHRGLKAPIPTPGSVCRTICGATNPVRFSLIRFLELISPKQMICAVAHAA